MVDDGGGQRIHGQTVEPTGEEGEIADSGGNTCFLHEMASKGNIYVSAEGQTVRGTSVKPHT